MTVWWNKLLIIKSTKPHQRALIRTFVLFIIRLCAMSVWASCSLSDNRGNQILRLNVMQFSSHFDVGGKKSTWLASNGSSFLSIMAHIHICTYIRSKLCCWDLPINTVFVRTRHDQTFWLDVPPDQRDCQTSLWLPAVHLNDLKDSQRFSKVCAERHFHGFLWFVHQENVKCPGRILRGTHLENMK